MADYLGFTPMEIKAGLIFRKPPRRLTIYNCRDNITVIDDTVHSHPQGVRAAIDVLSNIGKHRKIAIIGQMRELGELREEEYRKVGDYVHETGDRYINHIWISNRRNWCSSKSKRISLLQIYIILQRRKNYMSYWKES